MSIIRKVKALEKVFAALDQEINMLQTTSGLHCLAGCGKCCFKADIEATPLEFLPFAFHLLLTDRIEAVYQQLLDKKTPTCVIFKPVLGSLEKGTCSQYPYRGLICRLFAYSANRDARGEAQFITCKPIKENQPATVMAIKAAMKRQESVPMMSDYYFKIRSIDEDLGTKLMPINHAIQQAMEVVMAYYAYRTPPVTPGKLSA